jgi:selenocysteine lyase/cysteine desulfurase
MDWKPEHVTSMPNLKKLVKSYSIKCLQVWLTQQISVIGPSTTQLLRNLSNAINWSPGDELILSKFDHETNIDPWTFIAERLGLRVKWWTSEPTNTPRMDLEELKTLLSPRTRLVACTHASNLLGTINDVKAIAEVVHSVKRALFVVDGVAYAPHRRIDVKELGVDFYAFSWYKVSTLLASKSKSS